MESYYNACVVCVCCRRQMVSDISGYYGGTAWYKRGETRRKMGEELVGDLSFLLHYLNHFAPPPAQM